MKKIIILILCLFSLSCITANAGDEENFSDRDITKDLILENEAIFDEENNTVLLCPKETYTSGKAKYPFEVSEDFTVSFEYMIGGGSSADGIMLAFFAQKDSITKDGEYMNFDGCGGYGLEFDTYENTNDSENAHIAIVRDKVSNHLVSVDEPRVDDEQWHNAVLKVNGNNITLTIDEDVIINENIEFDKTYRYMYFAASTGACTDDHYIRNVRFTGRAAYSNASEWAIEEMDKAEIYNLIPEALKGKDMTKLINRQEFAALSVRLYENLTETTVHATADPFVDVDDEDVSKAYFLGITKGMSENEFSPDRDISRQEVATMLTRTIAAIEPGIDMTPQIDLKSQTMI